MNIEVHFCATAADMTQRANSLPAGTTILYRTANPNGETGDILKYTAPPTGPTTTLDSYAGIFVLLVKA